MFLINTLIMLLHHTLSRYYHSVFALVRAPRHWRLLLVATPLRFCGSEMSANVGDGSHRINITNGLLLYYNHYSFYSQKVIFSKYRQSFYISLINIITFQLRFVLTNFLTIMYRTLVEFRILDDIVWYR